MRFQCSRVYRLFAYPFLFALTEMGRPMKNHYPARTALIGLALFILINVMPGRASADDVTTSAAVQSLQQSIAQHQELLATQR